MFKVAPLCLTSILALATVLSAGGSAIAAAPAKSKAPVAAADQLHKTAPVKKVDANTALLATGAKLHKEGKIDEAEAIFRRVLTNDPRSVDAFYDLGAIAEMRGDYIAALGDYHAALALRPNDRELKEAVHATEDLLRKNGSATASTHVSRAEAKVGNGKAAVTEAPEPVAASPDSIPSAQSPASTPPSLVVGGEGFALPSAFKSADNKKFRLSSRKDGATDAQIPTLSVPEQFPDVTTPTANVPCPPASTPTLTVGQAPTSNHTSRRAASALLSVGAGMALRGSPLHCPICRLMHGY